MTPDHIHQFWQLLENGQAGSLLKLDDQSLVRWLTQQLGEVLSLNREEEAAARAYIQSRLLLIREVA